MHYTLQLLLVLSLQYTASAISRIKRGGYGRPYLPQQPIQSYLPSPSPSYMPMPPVSSYGRPYQPYQPSGYGQQYPQYPPYQQYPQNPQYEGAGVGFGGGLGAGRAGGELPGGSTFRDAVSGPPGSPGLSGGAMGMPGMAGGSPMGGMPSNGLGPVGGPGSFGPPPAADLAPPSGEGAGPSMLSRMGSPPEAGSEPKAQVESATEPQPVTGTETMTEENSRWRL